MQIRKLEFTAIFNSISSKLMPLFGPQCAPCPPSALTMTMMLPLCTIRPEICHHCQGFVLWFLKFISLKPTGLRVMSASLLYCVESLDLRGLYYISGRHLMPPPAYSSTSRVIIYIDCVTRSADPSDGPLLGYHQGVRSLSPIHIHSDLHHMHHTSHTHRREAGMRVIHEIQKSEVLCCLIYSQDEAYTK